MALTKDKYYKTRPRHHYWRNGGRLEHVEPIWSDSNMWRSVDPNTGHRTGAWILGYRLKKGAEKITKEEFENAYNRKQ